MSRPLNIWVVRDIEPLPTDPRHPRLMRAGMVCETLAARGHKVTWFNSSFDHYAKRQRELPPGEHVAGAYGVTLLPGPGYQRNVSVARIRHNRAFARNFLAHARATTQRPDVLVTDIPTTEAAEAVVRLGLEWDRPTLLSIRDLWPDFFLSHIHPLLRPLGRPLVSGLDAQARFACANATALLGISRAYLTWGQAKGRRHGRPYDAISPLGYRPVPVTPAARLQVTEKGVDFSKTLVSFVGSWGNTYDLQLLVDIAVQLRHRPDLQLVVAGSGDREASIRGQLAGLPNVVAPGWLSNAEIAALLDASAVGLLPYTENAPQGLPNKLFEYMAYGAFQVSTLTGEAAELLAADNLGVTAPNRQPAGIAALVEAAADSESPARRAHIRQAFESAYDADSVYGRIAELCETLAATHGK